MIGSISGRSTIVSTEPEGGEHNVSGGDERNVAGGDRRPRHAPRFSKTPAGAEPCKSQIAFYSVADRENITIAKQRFTIDLCVCHAFPNATVAMSRAAEALGAAAIVTKHGA
jgi:hypothetical protein